ncbi:MAG: hypothetical protein LBR34_10240 [Prevotella sp.]|jgi:hypothetical protein|nr:hypothetical protein [Prevotella sp.]
MKKILNFKWMCASALLLAALAGCSSDDDDNGGGNSNVQYGRFGEKQGKIVYETSVMGITYSTATLIFDDYGQKARLEEGGIIKIADNTTQKTYVLYQGSTTWTSSPYSSNDVIDGEVINPITALYSFAAFAGYQSSGTRPIAGKSCTVVSYSSQGATVEYAGWQGILFYSKSGYAGYESVTQAVSYSSDIPANSFNVN